MSKRMQFEPIENINPYENLKEILGEDMGSEIYKVVDQLKKVKNENDRLRSVVCLAVSERFPKKEGVEFLVKHRITNQFWVKNVRCLTRVEPDTSAG